MSTNKLLKITTNVNIFIKLSFIIVFAILSYNYEFEGKYWFAIFETVISMYWTREILK